MLKRAVNLSIINLNHFLILMKSLLSAFSSYGLSFVAFFIFIVCCLMDHRLSILFLLLSVPAPFVDFDTPKLYFLRNSFNLLSAPIVVFLELTLEYLTLLNSQARAPSFFFSLGSRLRLTHHLLR